MNSGASVVAIAAVGGLLSGLCGCDDKSAAEKDTDGSKAEGSAKIAAASASGDKACCSGKNDCKGKGGCKTADNACKGQNECKGKGGCSMRDCE